MVDFQAERSDFFLFYLLVSRGSVQTLSLNRECFWCFRNPHLESLAICIVAMVCLAIIGNESSQNRIVRHQPAKNMGTGRSQLS